MEETMQQPQPQQAHALVFPFPTHGHLTPLLHLAHRLAQHPAILVTVVITPPNSHLLLQHTTPQLDAPRVELLHLQQLPDGDGDAAAAASASVDQIFFSHLASLPHALEHLIRKVNLQLPPHLAVSCLISDIFMPWTQDVANKLGIPRVEFCTSSASGYCLGHHLQDILDRGYLPFKAGTEDAIIDFIPGVAPMRVGDLALDLLVNDQTHPLFQFLLRAFSRGKEAARVLVNSFYDLEAGAVDALRAENVRIIPIGPLLPTPEALPTVSSLSVQASLLAEDVECLKWLDQQDDVSVLYVSFGSSATFSVEEIQELALGIEASHQPFLWAIRPNAVAGALPDILPAGFQSRTSERGHIVSWAPQLAVLAHRAVGGFLSHCGWNSTLESMWMGVPIIGCPRFAEQNTNLKFTQDWKVGMAMAMGKDKQQRGVVKREAVDAAIMALMKSEEGAAARRRAMEVRASGRQAMQEGGLSIASLGAFLEDLKNHNLGGLKL